MLFSYERYKIPFKFRETLRSLLQNNKLLSPTAFIFPFNIHMLQSVLFFSYTTPPNIFTAAISVRIQNPVRVEGSEKQCKGVEKLMRRRKIGYISFECSYQLLTNVSREHSQCSSTRQKGQSGTEFSTPRPGCREEWRVILVRN